MTTSLTFNPYALTVGNTGLFNIQPTGLQQGTAYPEPGLRYQRRTGILSTTETIPMWGGVGIYEYVPTGYGSPPTNPVYALGVGVGRATGLTGSKALRGFSVIDGAYGMVTSPQSTVPLIGSGGQVQSYRLGSGMRIAVACDPSLASLRGGDISGPINNADTVSWDFVNQLLVPFVGTLTISSGTYNSTTGLVTLTMSAPITFSPGDSIVVSSLAGTGTNLATLNGTWTAGAGTTGSTVTYTGPTGEGSITISGGSLTLGSGASSALPVAVLDVQTTGCMTVQYNATTGFATYNYDGSAAIIQL